VIVYAEIDPSGTPRNVALDQTSGFPRLDQAAVETVRTWRFRNSSGRSVDITVPIRFVLRPNG
jgi:protein TonB